MDFLDVDEGRGSVELLDSEAALQLLADARRIAVVGASSDRMRPSHGVMRYLQHQGYDCVPVNPNCRDVLGVQAFASLEEAVAASGPFDIVDVFCRALWLQLGVVNWEAARIAREGGLAVVMDRCTAIEHRRLRESRRLG